MVPLRGKSAKLLLEIQMTLPRFRMTRAMDDLSNDLRFLRKKFDDGILWSNFHNVTLCNRFSEGQAIQDATIRQTPRFSIR